ncbi:hypothetical protein AI27_06500 [Sphingomonas sp. BHC-A]|nr:hypothetical protein AI27_06500 [Sphingomonas sp. BHC-A]
MIFLAGAIVVAAVIIAATIYAVGHEILASSRVRNHRLQDISTQFETLKICLSRLEQRASDELQARTDATRAIEAERQRKITLAMKGGRVLDG